MKYIVDILALGRTVCAIDDPVEFPPDVLADWQDPERKPDGIVWIFNGDVYFGFDRKNKPLKAGTLCHEVYHLVSRLCYLTGHKLDCNNDELCAYLAGYLYQELMVFVWHPKKIQKRINEDTKIFEEIQRKREKCGSNKRRY